MKKTIILSLFLACLFSCEKIDLCESENCTKYLQIWEELFIARNDMTRDYFNKHITATYSTIDSWNDGQSFRVEYKVKIDWAEATLADQFIIFISPSTDGLYPSLQLPRGTWLTKTQINSALDLFAFSSQIYKVAMVEHLKYATKKEAQQLLETESGIANLEEGSIWYDSPSFNECQGHPFLNIRDEIDRSKNECISCKLDLVTGDTEIRNTPCMISVY